MTLKTTSAAPMLRKSHRSSQSDTTVVLFEVGQKDLGLINVHICFKYSFTEISCSGAELFTSVAARSSFKDVSGFL